MIQATKSTGYNSTVANMVKRFGKILFYILNWAPLLWTILILLAARFCFINPTTHSIFYPLKKYFILTATFYIVYGGFFVWLTLTVLLAWKKIITKRQGIISIVLVASGILIAYLALQYDIFGVSGSYLD